MKAINLTNKMPGGERTKLSEVLPLTTPYVVQVFPIYACNFKCNYCIFQLPKEKRRFISNKLKLSLALWKTCVDDMLEFPDKIKVIRFVGIGEPLLHSDIIDMIAYTTNKNVANTIELLTNGSLLTKERADELIFSGLNRLVISIQGTSREKYEQTCEAINFNFEKFIAQIKYFYENKKDTHVYIKIVDSALNGKEDEENFYKIFGDICDSIAVEYTVPIHDGVNFKTIVKNKKITQFGNTIKEIKVCPQPFFHMQINPDGCVVPCYSFEYPSILGNIFHESIKSIWNNKSFSNFRRRMLEGRSTVCEICKNCNIIKYRVSDEDIIDEDCKNRLINLYASRN
jgi:radical SAM protein with 4Fe4S-binding SPASM domain